MIKACIFDLDGTLANTLDSMAWVANGIASEMGLKEQPVENFKRYCGDGADMLVRRFLMNAGDPELNLYEEFRQKYRERFDADPMYRVVPYDGVRETLKSLKASGAKLAVCSNKPHPAAVKVIHEMFEGYFDMVIGQSDKIRRKPAPDAPLAAAAEFGVEPGDCLYIGDTGTDMETGHRAGMHTVGAVWGFRGREELEANNAEILAEKPLDLIKIYEEYNHDKADCK